MNTIGIEKRTGIMIIAVVPIFLRVFIDDTPH